MMIGLNSYETQIKIDLTVYGSNFQIEKFSKKIEIQPTNFWSKGDDIPIEKGLDRQEGFYSKRKDSAWIYSTDFIKTFEFEDVSDLFVKKFKEKTFLIKNHIDSEGLELKVDIIIEVVDNNTPSLFFNKNFLNVVNELNVEIDTDIYLLSNEKIE